MKNDLAELVIDELLDYGGFDNWWDDIALVDKRILLAGLQLRLEQGIKERK